MEKEEPRAGKRPSAPTGFRITGATVRPYFSRLHILTGAGLARQAKALEFTPVENVDHQGLVVGSVFFAVAFLEATVNELFADAHDGVERLKILETDALNLLKRMWEQGIPRTAQYPVLEKYAIALTLARKPAFQKNQVPWQPVALLVRLRNALVHYEPEWIHIKAGTGEAYKPHKFEEQLKGRFPLNPLARAEDPFYPEKVLGHGCAAWAIKAAVAFADEFANRLGILPAHNDIRAHLNTE
jgi:hypothetical protein